MLDSFRFRAAVSKIRRRYAPEIKAIGWEAMSRAEARQRHNEIWGTMDAHTDLIHTHYLFVELDKLRLPRPELTEDNWIGGKLGNQETAYPVVSGHTMD
jgi:hypothetical protein